MPEAQRQQEHSCIGATAYALSVHTHTMCLERGGKINIFVRASLLLSIIAAATVEIERGGREKKGGSSWEVKLERL